MNLTLPHNWRPRPYQMPLWRYLSKGGRNAIVIAHRRYGKDEVALHHTACEAFNRVGSYVHMLPEYAQARKALWSMVNPHTGRRRIDEAFPQEIRNVTREDEMFIQFKNGSTWQLAGSDNFNALMGTSYCGMVNSEYALADPAAQGYFAPILIENKGWNLSITTPRGKNHAHAMYVYAKGQMEQGKDWFAELAPASKTGALDAGLLGSELARLQAVHGDEYGRALWLQEYECSFDAAIPGSIFGDCIIKAQANGQIGVVPLEPGVPVCTAWDLGRSDSTAIWFYQNTMGTIRLIDYHESNLKDMPFYIDLLRSKAKERDFTYDTHFLPMDAKASTLAANNLTVQGQLIDANVGRTQLVRDNDHQDGIQAARSTFPYVWIDEKRCERGIECLQHYHREWDDEKKMFSNKPEHDFSSHCASAFRTLALSWKPSKKYKPSQGNSANIAPGSLTFGELKRRHFAARRRERNERIWSSD